MRFLFYSRRQLSNKLNSGNRNEKVNDRYCVFVMGLSLSIMITWHFFGQLSVKRYAFSCLYSNIIWYYFQIEIEEKKIAFCCLSSSMGMQFNEYVNGTKQMKQIWTERDRKIIERLTQFFIHSLSPNGPSTMVIELKVCN